MIFSYQAAGGAFDFLAEGCAIELVSCVRPDCSSTRLNSSPPRSPSSTYWNCDAGAMARCCCCWHCGQGYGTCMAPLVELYAGAAPPPHDGKRSTGTKPSIAYGGRFCSCGGCCVGGGGCCGRCAAPPVCCCAGCTM